MRTTLAAILFGIAVALIVLSYSALENLWADYRDSPDVAYITVASIELVIAAVAGIAGFSMLRRR